MKSAVRRSWLIIISLLAIFLLGCTAGETQTPDAPLVPPTSPADIPIQSAEFPLGDFDRAQKRLSFMEDETFTVWIINVESFEVEDGRYAIDGNQINLTDEVCGPDEGVYTWQFEGDKLIFEVVEDTCEGRRESLAGNRYLYRP